MTKWLHFLPWIDREVKREVRREDLCTSLEMSPDEDHLTKTSEWVTRAQDARDDDGVSRAYSASSSASVGYKGWQPSYPETTGYIIPSMFALSRVLNDPSLGNRAVRMADWETEIQLSSGAVMGSVVTAPAAPAVFNTGQVVFGWLAAHRQTGKRVYLEAAGRAGDYLVSVQAEDGSWDKGDSRFAKKGATTYNTRVAWALIELGNTMGDSIYIESGRKFNELALGRQLPNGWFSQNCLNDPERPLLHTIVYATRGLLESGICLNEQRYTDAALNLSAA